MSNVGKPTYGIDPSYATSNKWWISVPTKILFNNSFPNLEMQVQQFYLPGISVGFVSESFQGYSIKRPASKLLNAGDKSLKFRYIIDDNWYNYTSLYAWAALHGAFQFQTIPEWIQEFLKDRNPYSASNFVPVRLYLLSPFKKNIVQFVFSNCWIQNFGEILLDGQNSNVIYHDITLSYDEYKIETPGFEIKKPEESEDDSKE